METVKKQRLRSAVCQISGVQIRVAAGEPPLHQEWLAALPETIPACPSCLDPATTPDYPCAACQAQPPPYWSLSAGFAYAFPIDRLLHRFKFDGVLSDGRLLADLLCWRFALPPLADAAIAPMPSHRSRINERRFDHGYLLARDVAKHWHCPLYLGLQRHEQRQPQVGMNRRQRQQAVRAAHFTVSSPPPGNVILIDDVMTTGSTLRAATTALLAAGCERVAAVVLARA